LSKRVWDNHSTGDRRDDLLDQLIHNQTAAFMSNGRSSTEAASCQLIQHEEALLLSTLLLSQWLVLQNYSGGEHKTH